MRWALWLVLAACASHSFANDWVIASPDARVEAGAAFEVFVLAPPDQGPPEVLRARLRGEFAEIAITLKAKAPRAGARRTYAATMPAVVGGTVTLQLTDRPSNVLLLVVARRDAVQDLTGPKAQEREPPLSEEDPMYFVVGSRGGWSARFQLSFKYRLFDVGAGFAQEQPWLSAFYFGYTQNSLWDLEEESKAFRDTSYRPSFFWRWERTDERAFFDGARLGLEHESNGGEGPRSRSINIAFVRPEWKWRLDSGANMEFTPKLYTYLDKAENTDIDDYRGYVDWRLRYDSGGNWIATTVARYGSLGKGSVLFDLSRRTRDVKFGPVGGYLHVQFFHGYGESILDYNVRRKSALRFGFAIVP